MAIPTIWPSRTLNDFIECDDCGRAVDFNELDSPSLYDQPTQNSPLSDDGDPVRDTAPAGDGGEPVQDTAPAGDDGDDGISEFAV